MAAAWLISARAVAAAKATGRCLLLRREEPQGGGIAVDGAPHLRRDAGQPSGATAPPATASASEGPARPMPKPWRRRWRTFGGTTTASRSDPARSLANAASSKELRPRNAINRAAIRIHASLLVDEGTSALDRTTEAAPNRTLHGASGRPTVALVTLRLTSMPVMDEIVVMDHGRIVQRGTHAQPVAVRRLSARLWKAQVKGSAGGFGSASRETALHPVPKRVAAAALGLTGCGTPSKTRELSGRQSVHNDPARLAQDLRTETLPDRHRL